MGGGSKGVRNFFINYSCIHILHVFYYYIDIGIKIAIITGLDNLT